MLQSPITKRQLGWLLMALGLLAGLGALLYDVVGLGAPDGGFGPSQQLGVAAALALSALGASLLPLGDTPA